MAKIGSQHDLLHAYCPPPTCCLCGAEARIADLESQVAYLRSLWEVSQQWGLEYAMPRIADLEREVAEEKAGAR